MDTMFTCIRIYVFKYVLMVVMKIGQQKNANFVLMAAPLVSEVPLTNVNHAQLLQILPFINSIK